MLLHKRVVGTVAYLGGLPAVLESWSWAWGQLIQHNSQYLVNPGERVHYTRATVSLHAFARNSIAQGVLGDWLVMLDTDHAPPPDLVTHLVGVAAAHNIQVATALYRHRAAPGCPVIYQWDEATGRIALPIDDWDREVRAFEIGSAGGGALFIRRDVLHRIRTELKQEPFDPIETYGEDHSFFRRCKQLGIAAYAIPSIESPHLEVKPLLMEDYTRSPYVEVGPRREVGGFA